MTWSQYHPPGTLVITTGGPSAGKMSYSYMFSILAGPAGVDPDEVASLSRFENTCKWLATLTQAAHGACYKTLHGKSFLLKDKKLRGMIEHMDKDRVKAALHCLPPTAKAQIVKKVGHLLDRR